MQEDTTNKEFEALIALLDDPDLEVFSHVSGKLASYGPKAIPQLETAWESTLDTILQERIEQIIHQIQFDELKREFVEQINIDPDNLYRGMVLMAKYRYPDLDETQLKSEIDQVRRAIWLEMNYHLTPFEQVNVFNHVFYTLMNYAGKTADKPDSNSFFLNNVVESKKGNALSLGVLYLIIAQDLDMPVYGVDLPRHFVLAYTKSFLETLPEEVDLRDEVIFYINALNRGTIFTRNEITLFLKKMEKEPKEEFFTPRRNGEIIKLILLSLASTYKDEGDLQKAKELEELAGLYN